MVIEGFDKRTGQTRWSLDAGPYLGVFPTRKAGPVLHLAEHEILVNTVPGGAVVLNLKTGKVTKAQTGAVATCMTEATFEYSQPDYVNDKPYYEHSSGELVGFCDSAGKTTTQLPAWAALSAAGTTVTGTEIVATPRALIGYRRV